MAQSPGSAPNSPETSLSRPPIVVSPWVVLLIVAMGFFMILLDTTIVNVAIPSMIDGLHATLDQILWILNAYILVYAVLLITAGRLGDMFGPKKMYLSGLILFTASSFLCGWAQNPGQLITFRVMQGVGGAILTPQSLSIIASIFPPERRGAAFGVWGGVAGLAAVAGPTLGGFLTTSFDWRAIFFVNVPIGILAVIAVTLMMPELTVHRRHHLDVVGIGLASAGLFALIFGLIEGEKYNWGRINDAGAFDLGPIHGSLISIPTLLLAGVILLAVFVFTEAGQKEPLLPLSLFRDRNFSVANLVSATVAFGMLGLFLPLTIYLQSVLGLTAEQAGVAMVPTSLTSMFIAPFAGRLADRLSAKWILFAGLSLFGLGMGLVIWVASLHSTGTTFTLPLFVAGLGMGCTFAPMVTVAMRNIAPAQAGAASGFINTIRQVGGTIGSAVVGAVLQYRLGTELGSQASRAVPQIRSVLAQGHVPPQAGGKITSGFVQTLSKAGQGGFHLGRGESGGSAPIPHIVPPAVAQQLQAIGHQVFRTAFLNAMKPSLALPIAVLLCGALVTTLMRTGRPPAGQEARAEREQPGGARVAS